MLKLLKIEWLKIKWYPAFWWILAIIALSYFGINLSSVVFYQQLINNPQVGAQGTQMLFGKPFSFVEIWHTVSYLSSLLITIPALMIIMLVTNEYSFKTHKQNIIVGWSRGQFTTAKLLDVLLLSVMVTILYIIACIVMIRPETGQSISHEGAKFSFIGYFFLQTFSQLSIAYFLAVLLKRSFIALGVFIFWSVIFEPILSKLLVFDQFNLGAYLPFEISDRMIPPPTFLSKIDPEAYQLSMEGIGLAVIYTIAFTLILWIICFRINAKRDL